ncbi:MAG: restriction endonuclease [Bacteroides uniformis]
MREINIPKEHDGFIYTIKSVDEDCILECPKTCWRVESDSSCSHIDELRTNSGYKICDNTINCIKVVFNVKNIGNKEDWSVGPEDAILVDNEGFCYRGVMICEKFHDERSAGRYSKYIPGTQVNYTQLFPLLPKGATISSIRVDIHNKVVDFNISEEKNDIEIMQEEYNPDNKLISEPNYDDIKYEIESLKRRINEINVDIYSYINNILSTSDRVKLENKISNEIYSIKLEINGKEQKPFSDIKCDLIVMEDKFKIAYDKKNEIYKKRMSLNKKIDELLELTPREFEEYVGTLYKKIGFYSEVTQYSNDKGVDVILFKDSAKYVIQCKRYRGTVGSPDIQKFIGAIEHAKADKGIFVTTGVFSSEAEKMAYEHPIELVDKIKLLKLIQSVSNEDY